MNLNPETDLEISRLLKAPRAKIWRAWADPNLLKEWWCPKPWVTDVKAFDFRPGGSFHTFMTGPDGKGGVGESDNPGCFLEIKPMEKIVWTAMLVGDWRPGAPWMAMTGVFLMADENGGTRYRAIALHPDAAAAKTHLDMGFHEGWGIMVSQMDEFAQTLKD